jgi:hypothetical protein
MRQLAPTTGEVKCKLVKAPDQTCDRGESSDKQFGPHETRRHPARQRTGTGMKRRLTTPVVPNAFRTVRKIKSLRQIKVGQGWTKG